MVQNGSSPSPRILAVTFTEAAIICVRLRAATVQIEHSRPRVSERDSMTQEAGGSSRDQNRVFADLKDIFWSNGDRLQFVRAFIDHETQFPFVSDRMPYDTDGPSGSCVRLNVLMIHMGASSWVQRRVRMIQEAPLVIERGSLKESEETLSLGSNGGPSPKGSRLS